MTLFRRVIAFGGAVWLCSCGSDPQRPSTSGHTGARDAGAPPTATGIELAAGDLDVAGITDDDDIAVLDRARGALVVSISGGDPIVVEPAADFVIAGGKVVFAFRNVDFVSGIADLTIWTRALGSLPFALGATFSVAASDDGTRILATSDSSSDGSTTTLILGGFDGAAPIPLSTVSRLGPCTPRLSFVGTVFVASHCAPGSTSVTISSIDPTSGQMVDLQTDAKNFIVKVPGATPQIGLVTASGDAFLVPLNGGFRSPLGQGVDGLSATADGVAFLARANGVVSRVPLDGTLPVTLVQGGAVGVRAGSPDGQEFLFQTAFGLRNGSGDLKLSSASVPGPEVVLSTELDTTTFGSAFTTDSSRVLYVTDTTDVGVGTLRSQPVAGGAVVVHSKTVWDVRSYVGSRIVFNDDYVPTPKRSGRATLRTLDTATDAEPEIVATDAGSAFVLSHAADRVVFSFDDGAGGAGLYAAVLP